MKRADIKVGDHLNWIDPTDSYGRDCEVIVVSDVPWNSTVPIGKRASITIDIDGRERTVKLFNTDRPAKNGNGVLVVFAEHGWNNYGIILQLRYLHPWTEENEAKAQAARELDKQVRRAHMRDFRIGAR